MSCALCRGATGCASWCPEGKPQPQLGDWLRDAACSLETAELFFPASNSPSPGKEALAICSTCPVVDECALHALEAGEEIGIWGSLTPNERRVYRKHLLKKHGGRVARRREGASA